MSFCFTSGEGTAQNAKAIFHRMQFQHSVTVDYELGLTQNLGITHEVRGPVHQIVTQPLGITHQVTTQHGVPYNLSSSLGIVHSVVHAGSFGIVGNSSQMVWATIDARVPRSGRRYFSHEGDVSHSQAPIVLAEDWVLTQATVVVDQVDSTNDYAVKVYDESGPTLVSSVISLASGSLSNSVTGLNLSLPAGSYGFRFERTSGAGRSDFNEVVLHFLIEKS